MIKIGFPSKFIPLSSSIIMVRPKQKSINPNSTFDYQVLMLKRSSKVSFANIYAFPGGVVEKQDYLEKWKSYLPDFYNESIK
jgi:ADP-ribose pyrophosphatase YjhB (NUDIX family)